MRMQLRVTRPRRPMPERGPNEPVATDRMDARRPPAGDGGMTLEITKRVPDGAIVRVAQHGAHMVVANAEEQAYALRRREGEVESRPPRREHTPERRAGGRMLAGQ